MIIAALLIAVSAPADLVIENARIWSDGRVEFAEFAAVRDGRFVAVGAHDASLIGRDTARVDAAGRTVIPGLIDSHVHMLGGGAQLGRLQLRDARDKDDFIARVAAWTEDLEPDDWILGGRYSVESWDDPEQPTRAWVDPVTGAHPLFLTRMDGHSGLANSAALALAGIDADGPRDPVGGVIDRDPETGEPTGILRESAMALVRRHIPVSTDDDALEALHRAIAEANRHGITAVADIPGIGDLPVYALLDTDRMRFFLYPTAGDWTEAIREAQRFETIDGWTHINGFKTYLDGSLGSRTAIMRDPYLNNEEGREAWRGLFREGVEDGRLARNLRAAGITDYQTIAHAIGDEANHRLLLELDDAYGDLAAARCRSEHTQHLLPEDIRRFAELGVIASMQPYHKADDGRYAESYIGTERSRSSYAFRSLLDAGAIVVFGSDWPVVTINPFLGIEAAVTGRTLDGKTWQPQENLSVGEALRCYTSRAAYAVFAEDEIGRIEPGLRADFVILNESPFGDDVDWSAIKPDAVYVEGRLVYEP